METVSQQVIINQALSVLETRMAYKKKRTLPFSSPQDTKDYLRLKMSEYEHEVFAMLLLDTRHRLIEYVELFRGTIDECSVHPREVVKTALAHNASAVIFAHNHPSGDAEPSHADRTLTDQLKESLKLVDVRSLDHIIVGAESAVSFAERGLM